MKRLKLKVCGMRNPENIEELIQIQPELMGFIFYPKSPRFAGDIDENILSRIPISIKKVGVFVNADLDAIVKAVKKYGLSYVQLHGDEELSFAEDLKAKGVKVIKVFRVMDSIPIVAKNYVGVADYFLFDTATSSYGGSGRHFDWRILRNYNLSTPFFLSGGVQFEDIEEIKSLSIDQLEGIDINSKFEIAPGLKDMDLVRKAKEVL